MRRRDFITLLGAAMAITPLFAARGQQKGMPVIGFIGGFNPGMAGQIALQDVAFRQGLSETGYVDGQNVVIEYHGSEGHLDELPALAADLVARKVDVIVTQGGDPASLAAKSATATIPIVFHTTSDPVAIGLITSLARPGGNLTGVSQMQDELMPKLLGLLLELVPQANRIGLLVNPDEPYTDRVIRDMQEAVHAKRVNLGVLKARTEGEIDAAFATLVQMQADGLVLNSIGWRAQIAALALRHAVPTVAPYRDFSHVGGLISYGVSLTGIYHLKGIYTGKILKGAKPALPVQQPTTFELVINLKTAKALGIAVPPSLLARADEVLE
jgi:putative ABC transport system substrate-binding protein